MPSPQPSSSYKDPSRSPWAKNQQRYRSPMNPVIFCHGLMGFDSFKDDKGNVISCWKGIKEVLEANGTAVLFPRVPAISSPVERAEVLAMKIMEKYKGRSVHLIGHSMGGIDARYVASHLQGDDTFRVLSVTTISSPHRGSYAADQLIDSVGGALPALVSVLNKLPIMGDGDGQGFVSLTTKNMKEFNEATPDAPGVQYFSWGAEFKPWLWNPLWLPHSIIHPKQGPNDGLVAVQSAKWGTYRGTLNGVSHSDLLGWVNTIRHTREKWMGNSINFKPETFYLEMADYLARVVEGGEE